MLLAVLVGVTCGNQNGAPLSSCIDMNAQHDQGAPDPAICPFFVSLERVH